MLLHDLLASVGRRSRALEGATIHDASDPAIHVVCCDSRAVVPGALFCCVRGVHHDGHDFAAAARDAGAAALVVERVVAVELPQVVVPSTAAAAGPLASAAHGDPSDRLTVAGITGTNGKTTVTYLLEGIAEAASPGRSGVIGTVDVHYGDSVVPGLYTTPDACTLQGVLARMLDAGVTTVAMEVSSHALDQHRPDGTRFEAACFTNLSQDHLDYHETMTAYGEAKARLFTAAFTDRAAVNTDDGFGRKLAARAARAGLTVLTYGADRAADVRLVDASPQTSGTRMRVAVRERGELDVSLHLVGAFNVSNALAAVATARLVGHDLDTIGSGLASVHGVPGRLERIDDDRGVLVFVDYAHTPDALARVLATVRGLADERPTGRVFVVFGCGGDRDAGKRPEMGAAAVAGSDIAVLTSDNPRSEEPEAIAADVLGGIDRGKRDRVVVELDRRRAIRDALARARRGDVVLIAGKGHETGQTVGGVTRPFDDRVVAREAIEELSA